MRIFGYNITKVMTEKEIRDLLDKEMPLRKQPDACWLAESIEKRLAAIEKARLDDSNTLHEAIAVIDRDLSDLEKAVQIIVKAEGVRQNNYAGKI